MFSPRSTTSETDVVGNAPLLGTEPIEMVRLNATCGNLDVHIQPHLRDLRECEKIWEGGGKEPGAYSVAKWTPRCVPVATRVPFEKKLQI